MICKPVNPKCDICIFSESCKANLSSMTMDFPKKLSKNKNRFIYYDYVIFDMVRILFRKINSGLWVNMYQFPVFQSDSCISLIDLKKMIYKNSIFRLIILELINENLLSTSSLIFKFNHGFGKFQMHRKLKRVYMRMILKIFRCQD